MENTDTTTNSDNKFKAGDRVIRAGKVGPQGIVQKIRMETVRNTIREGGNESPGVAVTVLWDNGTTSHFVPDGLELI
jgi:hypothetical protein